MPRSECLTLFAICTETTAESIELHKYVQMVVRHAAEGPIKTRGGTQGTRQKTGFARFKDIVLSCVLISNGEFCINCKLVHYRFGPRCCSDSQESRHRMAAPLAALLFASVPVPPHAKALDSFGVLHRQSVKFGCHWWDCEPAIEESVQQDSC